MSDDNDYGVEIRDVDHGGRTGERNTLYVDGDEVWIDWCSEPEDICLCRDLSVFVYTLRALAKDRHDARVELGAAEQARDALREENARLRAALRGLFKPFSVPYAQWTPEMHAAHIALEGQW